MSLARHLARLSACLLAVMIVMVVAGLSASAARAHDGHGHRQSAHIQAVQAITADAPVSGTASVTAASMVSPETLQAESDAPDSCGLCCSLCMACCHSVLMPALAAALPPTARPMRLTATQAKRPSGLAPEALRRPPRTLV